MKWNSRKYRTLIWLEVFYCAVLASVVIWGLATGKWADIEGLIKYVSTVIAGFAGYYFGANIFDKKFNNTDKE